MHLLSRLTFSILILDDTAISVGKEFYWFKQSKWAILDKFKMQWSIQTFITSSDQIKREEG